MRKYLVHIIFIIIMIYSHVGQSQIGEYLLINDTVQINSIELKIIKQINDSISLNLVCDASYSNQNKLDSIVCRNENNEIVSKFQRTNLKDGYINRITYFDLIDTCEIYKTISFQKGKYSSLEFSNNKDNKGYKLMTIFDSCCIESEKLWYTNDTLVLREIIQNIYQDGIDCDKLCLSSKNETYAQFYSIYLDWFTTNHSYDNLKASKYQEDTISKYFIRLEGDTIIKTKAVGLNSLSEIKMYSDDTINYREINGYNHGEISTNLNVKIYDTKYSLIREDFVSFEGVGVTNSKNYYREIINQHGIINYHKTWESEKEVSETDTLMLKSYKFDSNGNWFFGEFKTNKNENTTVFRDIKYK